MEQDDINEKDLDDVPLALNARKTSSSSKCDICFQIYHIMGRWPMLACPNDHFFCDHCIKSMFKISANQPVPCPICRALIRHSKVKPHYQLFRAINKQSHVKQALKQEQNQLFLYAYQHQIFEVAAAFKEGKVEKIAHFTRLDCSNRKILKIEFMGAFPELVLLRFNRNMLIDTAGLEMLINLRYLNLSHNKIKDMGALGELKNLTHLAVQFNQIEEISSLLPFSHLSHWYLFGNPLKSIIADQLLLVEFPNLLALSLTCTDQYKLTEVFLKGLAICDTIPKLNKIYLQDIESYDFKRWILKEFQYQKQVVWISMQNKAIDNHSLQVEQVMIESEKYGQIFQFKADQHSDHIKNYKIEGSRITKETNIFGIISSQHCIPKQGKINFKVRIQSVSEHMIIGLCNAFVKGNPNVYSQHFVGLALWGYTYSRGDTSNITGKLRLEDKPVIRMSVDREGGFIRWFSDDHQVAFVHFPQQFKHSSLYFVLGIRDAGTSLSLLND